MSLKNKDEHNRWRNKTVAFRVSPEEWEQMYLMNCAELKLASKSMTNYLI